MHRALDLAERGGGATSPNPMVGCVLVGPDGRTIGEGWHARAGGPHAEVAALADAVVRGADPRGATAVVSLEPCAAHGRTPPCTDVLAAAGIGRVVYGAADPHTGRGGEARLAAAGIEVAGGVLRGAAERLNEPWLHWIAAGRPFLHLKVAHTRSGHVTRGAGGERWITGPAARTAVHRLRRRHAAILVGVATVLADDPELTVRHWPPANAGADPPWPEVQPLRVVLDSALRIPPESRLARSAEPGRPVLVLCTAGADPAREAALVRPGLEVERIAAAPGGVDLGEAVARLAGREITGVLVEPGPTLAAALLSAGLADRWTAFVAPDARVGDGAVALYAPEGPVRRPDLAAEEHTSHGDDTERTGLVLPG